MAIFNFINEKKVLDSLLKNKKTIKNNTYQKLVVYIKHLKSEGKTKAQVREELDCLMTNYYSGFVMADWDSLLQKITNKYTKAKYKEFRELKQINITNEELTFIKDKQDIEVEKLLFTLLVIAKVTSNGKSLWVSCDSKDIFKMSKFKYDKNKSRFEQREFKIYDLSKRGLLSIKQVCDSTDIKLLYGSLVQGEGLTLTIDEENSNSIIYEYLKWCGDKSIKSCENCGILIQENPNSKKNTKYCSICAKKVKMENDRRIQKERYKLNSRI